MTLVERLRRGILYVDSVPQIVPALDAMREAADRTEALERQDQFHRGHIEQQAEIIARLVGALREIEDIAEGGEHISQRCANIKVVAHAALKEEE